MCTIVLSHEEATHGIVVGQTADSRYPLDQRSCGYFKYAGRYLKLVVAFAGMPARYGEKHLPVEDLFSATENNLKWSIERFAESIRKDVESSGWTSGVVVVASATKIFKITGPACTVEAVNVPFIAIGQHSDAVELLLHESEQWAGAYLPVMGTPGIIANAITRAWAPLSEQPKYCSLVRYML